MIGERVGQGMREKAKQGKSVGSNPPYGYRYIKDPATEKSRLEIHEQEAQAVQYLFTQYRKLRSIPFTIAELHTHNIRTRSGKPWKAGTVAQVLKNPVYVGMVRWNGTTQVGTHKPLVDGATFDLIQGVMAKQCRVRGKGRSHSVAHPMAVQRVAEYWGVAIQCQWPSGCTGEKVQINHIYGDRKAETLSQGTFYEEIIEGRYPMWRLNLLCRHHNHESRWGDFAWMFAMSGDRYKPGFDRRELEVSAKRAETVHAVMSYYFMERLDPRSWFYWKDEAPKG
jgi:hypothetical protein